MKKISILLICAIILTNILAQGSYTLSAVSSFSDSELMIDESISTYRGYYDKVKNKDLAKDDIVINGLDYNSVSDLQSVSEKDNKLLITEKTDYIEWIFNVDEDCLFNLCIYYETIKEYNQDIECSIRIDNSIIFEELSNVFLQNYFSDSEEGIRKDDDGNEIYPSQICTLGRYKKTITDAGNTQKCVFYLEKGEHILTLENISKAVAIEKIAFEAPTTLISYKEYVNSHKNKDYSGKQIALEAEATETLGLKSRDDILSGTDNMSANISPKDAVISKINYIGGNNWSQPGDSLSWKIKVNETGYYKIGLNYKQNKTLNASFYRQLKINGEVPFKEANYISFPYAREWTFIELGDEKDTFKFYFEAGKEYDITLSVTLGPIAPVCEELGEIVNELAYFYHDMIMITGDSPDLSRDYNLFEQIDNWDEFLNDNIKKLTSISDFLNETSNSSGLSSSSTIDNMVNVMELMRDNKYSAHRYISRYFSNYASISALLKEFNTMPISIDKIYIGAPKNEFESTKVVLFERLGFSIKKFFVSFLNDYSSNKNSTQRNEKMTIWVNWGRDQVKVLKYLIQSDFSIKNDVYVDIKLTNASLTHAILSGNGPDCYLHLSRSEPVNLAMRGAVYDLTNFNGTGEYADLPKYNEILECFMPNASTPYWFTDDGHTGLYALPDTQSFFMMFVRTDILKNLGLEIPQTWQEFDNVSKFLLKKNLQIGMPYTQITEMTTANVGIGALSIFPTVLQQYGESIYNEKGTATNLTSATSISVFEKWSDYYLKFGFQKSYDFFNRFRVGIMPIAIQNYAMYAILNASAPEIANNWIMTEVPGVANEDGTVNNSVTGGGTGAVILSQSKNKSAAWKFITWWTSEEIQYQYGNSVESILGPSARNSTANVEALKRYKWDDENLDNLLKQWEKVEEIPEIPGGYYVSRVIDQAFWNTVNGGEEAQDMLLKWTKIAENEIQKKREDYDIN